MADKIDGIMILHDRCEKQTDSKETYLMEYSLDGRAFRIGAKRKELWGYFESANRDEPLQITTTTITKGKEVITYVSGVVSVAKIINDRITLSAIDELLHRALNQLNDEKIRSQSFSYTKDLICAEALDLTGAFAYAKRVEEYIKGGDKYAGPEFDTSENE